MHQLGQVTVGRSSVVVMVIPFAGWLSSVEDRDTVTLAVPVVFLVLPVTLLFALFPGFYGLSFMST